MYRSRLWTMRQFAGFGTAADTNQRFKELLRSGGDGLSTAFDMPTLLGRDSDDPLAKGEVGRAGVAVDTLADMETLFSGIDLGTVSTSMTINSPAAVIMAMYVGVADKTGVARGRAVGHHPERHLEGVPGPEGVRLPAPTEHAPGHRPHGLRRRRAAALAPGLGLGLPHPRGRIDGGPGTGLHLGQRLRLRGSRPSAAGMAVDDFAPRLSFFFNAHMDFFEEIAKYRAARRIWARWLRDRYGASDGRSLQLRFHTQTAGVSLTAQQPEVNLVRVAIEALAGVLGGTQSLHTDSFDEALALPTEHAVRLALRTQQVIAEETGVVHVADPLGGSWFVEELTDEMERQAEEIFAHIEAAGSGSMLEGAFACIEDGWFVAEIADASYRFQTKLAKGEWIQVGVNGYTEGDDTDPAHPLHRPRRGDGPAGQLGAGEAGPRRRCGPAGPERLGREAADTTVNLMPALIEAAQADVTVGESMSALEAVFGTWYERSVV